MQLSIIIPVYKVEHTLSRCVESVLLQSFKDWEMILVDDGSPDSSGQICDEYAQKDSRIKVIHKENGGLSDARNAGLEVAEGKYVTFLDSDDYIASDTLSPLMQMFQQNTAIDIVEYNVNVHHGHQSSRLLNLGEHVYSDVHSYWFTGRGYDHTYACNKIFKRELFRNVQFPKGKVFEDMWTMPLILKQNPIIATTNQGMYYYCWNTEGITCTANAKHLQSLLEAQIKSCELLEIDLNDGRSDYLYVKILNNQISICKLTKEEPQLVGRRVMFSTRFTFAENLKLFFLNIFGIKTLCKLLS